jgi:hypothetical protein
MYVLVDEAWLVYKSTPTSPKLTTPESSEKARDLGPSSTGNYSHPIVHSLHNDPWQERLIKVRSKPVFREAIENNLIAFERGIDAEAALERAQFAEVPQPTPGTGKPGGTADLDRALDQANRDRDRSAQAIKTVKDAEEKRRKGTGKPVRKVGSGR